jgi:hypothetical protein
VVRRAVAIIVAVVAMAWPAVSFTPEAGTPAEVEKKAGTLEADELLAPSGGAPDLAVGHGVDLGTHGPARSAPRLPFLEVPEYPPERG